MLGVLQGMRAAVCERYGPPEAVVIREVETPRPKDNEVLVRTVATTVNSGDARIRAARVPRGLSLPVRLAMGWSGPKQQILGFDGAGEVAAVGSAVTRYKPGDRVIASRGFASGTHAEYFTVAEDEGIAKIADGVSYTDAVSLPFGAATALHFFDLGKLKAGESLLINGASGAVGTAAVQIAKHMGATVTAVCSGANAELVRSLGADRVIDYRKEDFTRLPDRYDLIMDNHGNAPLAKVKHLLKPGGRFLMVIGDLLQMLGGALNKQVISADGEKAISSKSYAEIMDLAARGVLRPVIDSTYAFEDIAEAHRRVDSDRKVGSVVVII